MISGKPNIILITTDQQRFDTFGDNAPKFLCTPHMNRLAYEGITFTSAYADCPLCVPARVSIMTGNQVFKHGMSHNGETSEVIDRDKTLPTYLGKLGYQTAAIGKMHFGPQRIRHGFDEMIIPEDYYNQMNRSTFGYQPMRHGLGQNELFPGMATVPECQTLTAWTAEQCVNYIRERRDPSVPFFLWCSFSKPHPPLDPPEPYYSMYRNREIQEPLYGDWSCDEVCPQVFKRYRQMQSYDLIPLEIIREAKAAYYGLITHVDYSMGRVFASLQDKKMLDETMIIFASDHGEYLGDHHAGAKGFFHEPSAHIPFILRLPKSWGMGCQGIKNTSLVTHADILPTIVGAAGGEIPKDIDGINLIHLINSELTEERQYLEGMVGNVCEWLGKVSECDYLAIMNKRWKYIWYPEGEYEQLFDLYNDPKELINLAGVFEYNDKLIELKNEMIKRHEKRNSKFVQRGRLISKPKDECDEKMLRSKSWQGYHTEYYDVDVRH